jgi:hydrophobic/amphiphilic exporter-1 (mainly G- bacteria), HAE1 family
LSKTPEVKGAFTIVGFGGSGTAPNRGMLFADLKDFRDRKGPEHSGASVVDKLRGQMMAIPGGLVVPFSPPAVQGASQVGGFTFELEDLGQNTLQTLANAANGLVVAGNGDKKLAGLFTSFTANDPQILVKLDRDKAKSLQVPISQITDALQVFMGSVYVNDFDFNNRSYRVYVQADQQDRMTPADLRKFYVRTGSGQMVSLDNLVSIEQSSGPQVINHYNLFRSAEIDGQPKPGVSSGDALVAMQDLAKKMMMQGMTYEWTGLSLEEIESSGKAIIIFGLGILVVYLTLSAQYESFALPFIILLAVPMAVLGALGLVSFRNMPNDVYCQIGLVMLIGLSAKNSILIVEFAEQLRRKGRSITEAAIEAAELRLRPILMTSFAFILGVLPLVFATGAGALGRRSVGTTIVGGMLLSTILNLVFIPVLYVILSSLLARFSRPRTVPEDCEEPTPTVAR